MSEALLIDFETEETSVERHADGSVETLTQPFTTADDSFDRAALISGLQIHVFAKDDPNKGFYNNPGVSATFDVPNNKFILTQDPQTNACGGDLCLSINLDDIDIQDNQERPISSSYTVDNKISTIFIKPRGRFDKEIISYTASTLQLQKQDYVFVHQMCSLSPVDLMEGAMLEIFETARDLRGEKNKLVELLNTLTLGNNSSMAPHLEDQSNSSLQTDVDDIWNGLECLTASSTNLLPAFKDKIIDTGVAEPWFKPEFVQPQLGYKITSTVMHHRREKTKYSDSGYDSGYGQTNKVQEDASTSKPVENTSNPILHTEPQPQPQRELPTDPLRNSMVRSSDTADHKASTGEAEENEGLLQSLTAKSKAYWDTNGSKTATYGERNTKFTKVGRETGGRHATGSPATHSLPASRFVHTQNKSGRGRQSCMTYNNRAPRGRREEQSVCSPLSNSQVINNNKNKNAPLAAWEGRSHANKKACYISGTPFGGWSQAKRGQGQDQDIDQDFVGESHVSFQRGLY